MNTTLLGRWGEEQAARYLESKGYRIVTRNLYSRWGEIDIIAETDDILVFVEVKLRKNANYARAMEYVTYSKQRKLITTAKVYISQNPLEKMARFDVIEVYAPQGEKGKIYINHIENAFYEVE